MMANFALTIFIVSALLIGGECGHLKAQLHNLKQTRAAILVELSSKVVELQGKTGLVWIEETLSVTGKKKSIKNLQRNAENTIDKELTNLDNQVGKAVEKATKSGKDISKCMVDEQTSRWTKVDAKTLSQCQTSVSYALVELKLTELISIPTSTAGIVPKCTLFHPFNNNNFKKCLQDELDNLNSQLSKIKKNIEDDLNDITKKAKSCIENKSKSLEKEIKGILKDFNKCVKNAKKASLE